MNTHNFGHLKGFTVVALLMASAVSCAKSDLAATPDALAGSWKVTDMTIVNEEAGIHRTGEYLDGIGKSMIQFAADRGFLTAGSKQGTWMHEGDVLVVTPLDGGMIQYKVSQSTAGIVHLQRDLPAAGGLSAATVFYSLVKE